MRVAVTQANYIPWLGYFDLLDQVDLWVNLDNVQVVSRSFMVRNRIRLLSGEPKWLSASVAKAPRETNACEASLSGGGWHESHLNAIRENYRHAPFIDRYLPWLADILRPRDDAATLASHNERIIKELMANLGVTCHVTRSSELVPSLEGSPQEKMLAVLARTEATSLWNFQRGVDLGLYDATQLNAEGIELVKQEYEHPSYRQLAEPFLPYLSVIDLMLNEGDQALEIIRSGSRWKSEPVEPAQDEDTERRD